jgi:hypothetical protein
MNGSTARNGPASPLAVFARLAEKRVAEALEEARAQADELALARTAFDLIVKRDADEWTAWRKSAIGDQAAVVISVEERRQLAGLDARIKLATSRVRSALRSGRVAEAATLFKEYKVYLADAEHFRTTLEERARTGVDNRDVLSGYVFPGERRAEIERDEKGFIKQITKRERPNL